MLLDLHHDAMLGIRRLIPLPLLDFKALSLDRVVELLFENVSLMPIFQVNSFDAQDGFYALNRFGNLAIFELKRRFENSKDYCQVISHSYNTSRWTFDHLQEKYNTYCKENNNLCGPLDEIHQKIFHLENPLLHSQFNKERHLYLFGEAEDDNLISLITSVDSCHDTELIPYQIYDIQGKYYYQFLSVQYHTQRHRLSFKGVLFDISYCNIKIDTWDSEQESRIYVHGSNQYFVDYFYPADIVFFFQQDRGIFAAAEVIWSAGGEDHESKYSLVDFLTPKFRLESSSRSYLSFERIMQITGKSYFWAKAIKKPDFTGDESDKILKELEIIYNIIPKEYVNWKFRNSENKNF